MRDPSIAEAEALPPREAVRALQIMVGPFPSYQAAYGRLRRAEGILKRHGLDDCWCVRHEGVERRDTGWYILSVAVRPTVRVPLRVRAGQTARQGDWLLLPCDVPEEGITQGRYELPGQARVAHAYTGSHVPGPEPVLAGPGLLEHDEHRHLALGADGAWRCVRQRQVDPRSLAERPVVD